MKFEDEKNAITIPKYQNCFIYFLLKDKEVVYVGQTKNGLFRPFSHKDKDFDEIKIIYCDEKHLDLCEDLFIKKYVPFYNKQLNYAVRWSLTRVRNNIRKQTSMKSFSKIDLRKIANKLNIKIDKDIYTKESHISFDDYVKIMKYISQNEV